MRKAILLYNPHSGRRRKQRVADVEAALAVFRKAGVEASMAETRGSSDTAAQASQAIAQGCDTVFACGGDGTIHDVLQALVGPEAALGIIPLGTANSLAHDLGLPLKPEAAAQAALNAKLRRVAVGRVEYRDLTGQPVARYFTVAVGIGVDAHLFYKLNPVVKRHFGMAAYCARATWLWLTHPLEKFTVEITEDSASRRIDVSQILAVRIRDFGGVLRELAPGASLDCHNLRFVLFRTRSRIAYLRYVVRGLLGVDWSVPGIELVNGSRAACSLLSTLPRSRIYVEADGELLGTLPAQITMMRDTVNLLAGE